MYLKHYRTKGLVWMSKYKKNKAAALKYNAEEDAAPVVIASGYGTAAEKIIGSYRLKKSRVAFCKVPDGIGGF